MVEVSAAELAEVGVTISDLEVELTSVTPREALVNARAKIRKGILGASATFTARAKIDDGMILRVTDPQLTSRNPVIAAILLVARERINQAVASPIDLNAALPSGLRLTDIAFDFGERIRVDVSLG